MCTKYIIALFWVLLIVGYTEVAIQNDTIAYLAIGWLLVAFAVWYLEDSSLYLVVPTAFVDAFLILKIFGRDIEVPRRAGGFRWF
ncbi:MAG TPA: hypothetical protein VG944_07300 [Fimbriimonas sp.]|nr:hypothetical protein [Fimbriimonas sp.]